MQHFFSQKSRLRTRGDGAVYLDFTGEDYNHMVNVLRMKAGEEFSVRLEEEPGREYRFGVDEINPGSVSCLLRFVKESDVELPARIYLFQGLPKSDKLELIIQKAVELGVYAVIPVITKRCVVKNDANKAARRTERLQKIAEAAAKQSGRGIIPVVSEPVSFREALLMADREEITKRFIPYELADTGFGATRELMESLQRECRDHVTGSDENAQPRIAIFIGPEGGFEPSEVDAAGEAGFTPITLGKRILRTETAPIAVLSWLCYLLEP